MIDTNINDSDTNDSSDIADTKHLQWCSVRDFMVHEFGAYYLWDDYLWDDQCFVVMAITPTSRKQDRTVFSVNSAIKLHNDLRIKCDKRLVAKAKLQWSKKRKSLICQSNIVKMVNGNKLEDWVDV